MNTAALRMNDSSFVSWGSAPFSFQLYSNDAPLLRKAATIFRPWRAKEVVTAAASPAHRWFVEFAPVVRAGTQHGWRINSTFASASAPATFYRSTITHALTAIEYGAIQALLESSLSPPCLHSALVAKEGAGVLIIGRGEAGKSTLACALWQRGWTLLSDDCCLLDVDSTLCTARPVPRRVSLRAPSRTLLGDDLWKRINDTPSCAATTEGLLFHPNEIDKRERATCVPLKAAIFLQRREAITAPAMLKRLNPAQALLALLPYSNLVRQLAPGDAMNRLSPIAAQVPAYDLGRGNLTKMITRIEDLMKEHT